MTPSGRTASGPDPDTSLAVASLPRPLDLSTADGLLKCSHRELCIQREGTFLKTEARWVHPAQPSSDWRRGSPKKKGHTAQPVYTQT